MPAKKYDESRVLHAEIRVVDADERAGVIEGVAAPFGDWTPVGGYLEQLTPETFAASVKERGHKIPLLMHHDHKTLPVGKPVDWRHDDGGLVGVWQMDMDRDEGREAWRVARDGFITGLSVGFQPNRDTDVAEERDGVQYVVRGPGARLYEVSMVSVAAYPAAQITMTRTAGLGYRPDPRIEAIRRELGLGRR